MRTFDICEQRETLDVTIPIHHVVGHLHISLADGLTLDTTEMDGLRLRHLADDLDNIKAVGRDQVCVDKVPDGTGNKVAIVDGGVFGPDGELISGKDHSDQVDVVAIYGSKSTPDYQKF